MNKFFIFAHLLVLWGGGKIEIVFSVEASEIIYFSGYADVFSKK